MTNEPVRDAGVIICARAGCLLCDEAVETVRSMEEELGIHVIEVDIDADANLRDRYDHRVPVVSVGGRDFDAGGAERWLLHDLIILALAP